MLFNWFSSSFTVNGGVRFGYQGNKSIQLDINLTHKILISDFFHTKIMLIFFTSSVYSTETVSIVIFKIGQCVSL